MPRSSFVTRQGCAPRRSGHQSVVGGLDPSDVAAEPRIKPIRDVTATDGTRGSPIETPRYQASTEIIQGLGVRHRTIFEIAGNHHILTTVILPAWKTLTLPDAVEIFSIPIQSNLGPGALVSTPWSSRCGAAGSGRGPGRAVRTCSTTTERAQPRALPIGGIALAPALWSRRHDARGPVRAARCRRCVPACPRLLQATVDTDGQPLSAGHGFITLRTGGAGTVRQLYAAGARLVLAGARRRLRDASGRDVTIRPGSNLDHVTI